MSQRTILEINHDAAGFALDSHDVNRKKLFVIALQRALASGSEESWEPLKRYGITRITQCHHSEDRKVVVADREYPFG